MSFVRWVALGALLAFAGCDVAVMMLVSNEDDGHGSDPAPLTSPPTANFRVAVAWLPYAAAADAARDDLIASNGIPTAPLWKDVDAAQATSTFDPDDDPASVNTILIRVGSEQNYRARRTGTMKSSTWSWTRTVRSTPQVTRPTRRRGRTSGSGNTTPISTPSGPGLTTGGAGDDRAVSVAIHGNLLVVSGTETVSQGLTNSVLRIYSK